VVKTMASINDYFCFLSTKTENKFGGRNIVQRQIDNKKQVKEKGADQLSKLAKGLIMTPILASLSKKKEVQR
jgi:hypothetical protein